MTTDTQLEPTDEEIAALRSEFGITSNGRGIKEFTQVRDFARAVLAKWGQPAHSGAPVAWLNPWRADQVSTDYDAYGKHGIPLYTAPQQQGWCNGCSPENCPGCMPVPAKKQP